MACRIRTFALISGWSILACLGPLACGGDEDPALDDDDSAEELETACSEGDVHDPALPPQFADAYPDGCVPAACGVGAWGELAEQADAWFVSTDAEPDGDGSIERPMASVQDALDAASASGGQVAVAAGTYEETLRLNHDHDAVQLAGRCRELVEIDASGGAADDAGVHAEDSDGGAVWQLSGLTIRGGQDTGVFVSGGQLSLDSVALHDNIGAGVYVYGHGSSASLVRAVLAGALSEAADEVAPGLLVQHGGAAVVTDSLIEGNGGAGIYLYDDASAELEGVTVQETLSAHDGTGGWGAYVMDHSSLAARDVVFVRNHQVGIGAYLDSTVELTDVSIEETLHASDGTDGHGVFVWEGAALVAQDVQLVGNADCALVASYGGSADLLRVTISDTRWREDGTWGRGIEVSMGSSLRAEDCVIERNGRTGIYVGQAGSTAQLIRTDVREQVGEADGFLGRGIEVYDEAVLEAVDCVIEGNPDAGLYSSDYTDLTLSGVEVRDSRAQADGEPGAGIVLENGATLTASDCLVEATVGLGIIARDEGTLLNLDRVHVRDTRLDPSGDSGHGIAVQAEAVMVAEDCLLEDNTSVGIFVGDGAASVALSGTEVRNTRTNGMGQYGRGMEVQDGGQVVAEDCLFEGNATTGILAAGEGVAVHLTDVRVEDTVRGGNSSVGNGISCQEGAIVDAVDVSVSGSEGPGLLVSASGHLTCTGCELEANGFAGAVVWYDGTLEITDSTIVGTVVDAAEGGGVGVYASNHVAGEHALTVERTTIEDHPIAAVWLQGDGDYSIRDCTLVGGVGEVQEHFDGTTTVLHGDAVVATGGVANLTLEGNTVEGALRAGILLDGSSASLADNVYADNETDLVWQDCEDVIEPTGLGEVGYYDQRCGSSTLPIAPLELNLYAEFPDITD
jgi:hypothetical protein